MFPWIVLLSLVIFCPSFVEADQDSDEDLDLLFWKTVKDGPGLVYVYENVDLQASSFMAVCLGYQFNRGISVDGEIFLGPSSRNRIFEWKSHLNAANETKSYSRLQCFDRDNACYTTEESKCADQDKIETYLPFGHCKKDMSMIIKQKTITISCGDEIRTAERCSGGNAKELFKVTVEEFKEGVCATRIQPIKTGWIDILSNDGINRTVDLRSHSLIINQLMIREKNPDTTSFSLNFYTDDSDEDDTEVLSIQLDSGGTYIYKTSVTLNATVCSSNNASKKFYVGNELGKTQIQITLVGDQVAIVASDSANGNTQDEGIILLPSCDALNKELSMSVEDTTANRELSLIGNTNIKIIQKGQCSEPNVKEFNLHIKNEYSLQIGSTVRVDCEDPTYEVEGSNTIVCQWNKTWSPQPFPNCVRKTCVTGQYLNKKGQCKVCPEGNCNITNSESMCTRESLEQQGLKIADLESSHLLGSEIQVVCLNLMEEIVGNDKIHCVLTTDEDHEQRRFPVCEKKKCEAGKFLAYDGSCMDSICPKGQYAGEGTGECLECKRKGDMLYSDTVGSADCKICDGEVDSRRTFCLQRDTNSQPPGSESSTKLYLYIAMAVVAVLVHALAFGIAKWREIQNSREKRGPEYFARRFKKYNSTSCSLRVLGKKQPEISIQYAFPDALLALEGEKHKKELDEGEVEGDGSESPADDCDHKYNQLNDQDQEDDIMNPGPLYEDMTCSSGQDVVVATTDKQSEEPTYVGISDIPFPNMKDEQPTGYEDVSIMPLPSNIDSVLTEDGKYCTLKKDGNEARESSAVKIKKKKTFKDIALSTLKKDGTMKKDLTKKKSASADKKDDTLRRNTIKKTDNKISNNNSRSTIEDEVERYNALNQDGTEDTDATYTRISVRRKS